MDPTPRYSSPLRALHWLIFLVALIAVAAIEIHDFFPKGSAQRTLLFSIHQSAGVSVLILMSIRLMVRFVTTVPPPPAGFRLLEFAVSVTHVLLYALMIAMPILGVLAVALDGEAVRVFGIAWMLPVARDERMADAMKDLRESGATLVYVFVGLHAAAALWHEFILKDNLLRRML